MTNIFNFGSQKIANCFLSQKQVPISSSKVKLEMSLDYENLIYTLDTAFPATTPGPFDMWCVTKFDQ